MYYWYWRLVTSLGLLWLVRGEQGKIGKCDRDDFFEKDRQCKLNFFVSRKQNPQESCTTLYLHMVNCSKNVLAICVEETESGADLTGLLDATVGIVLAKGDEENKYCREGGLPLTAVSKVPLAQEKRCADRYYRQTPTCGDDFISRFQQNPADESLCREYTRVIDCAKFKIEQYCERAEAKDLRNELSEDFNPYCEADKIIAEAKRSSASCTVHAGNVIVVWTSLILILWSVLRTYGL
ncbi:uncharacterized protein [Ptychodera flava]|uniref:uncharacterized protein n=1 Tax=Ptychodera flava TaxID=63121 RepID=UPI003969E071